MSRSTMISLLACSLIACIAVAAAQRGKPDFTELAKMAERYELPQPPADAKLVLANTGWSSSISSPSTSHDPGIYRPAFLLKPLPNGEAEVLMGWEKAIADSDAEHRPATRPYSLTTQKPKLKGYLLSCDLSSFVIAVQLARRDRIREAKQLWSKTVEAEYLYADGSHDFVNPAKSKPREILAHCIYQHYYRAVLAKNADLKAIHKKLVRLKQEFPAMFSDKSDDYFEHRRTRFVQDLGLTVAAKKPTAGSVEALLIEWGNRSGEYRHLGYFDERNVDADQPARAIFQMGSQALPQLAELVDDQRLTKHVSPAFMNSPESRVRLGGLASRLLEQMSGAREVKTIPSVDNDAEAEREFFENAALAIKDGRITGFNETPLWILGEKYPESLIRISTKITPDLEPNPSLFWLSETIAKSKLTRQQKSQTLAALCGRLPGIYPQRSVLQQLAKVDGDRCSALLRPLLQKLPKDVDEPYWTCGAASYTHVVMQLENDEIWKQYLAVAKRSAVGLRMEMMNPMNYTYIGSKNRERRLAFLSAFLDDATLRDKSVNASKYGGPCAAFTIPKIQVRDFAAMKIASILKLSERPTEFWTQEDWGRLREMVREKLKGEQLPNLE